jgi:DNA topoisomerase IA
MPFITSSLQQAASSHLKLSPDTTMKLAQQLYENGHITYMRTDSPSVSPEGQAMAKATIRQLYGDNYIGSTRYAAKGNARFRITIFMQKRSHRAAGELNDQGLLRPGSRHCRGREHLC